ncbi:hypothetical protein BABINDRAFT_159650 [Babjeviella inositovora NRRL Y-12698]|uniref:Uncharacterized protein n=1 Tax=Babjeviella inositovora NRRL Y-12698 TaxID=984486 RepID=A0A1E3QZU4_9ASCO|nr:uncharacterized protein BABINDRAFT_159650 [Babjeviella inositovora NRRL Y-12698]ODQ83209.1 hypothetical protein BABINDRAFT_159650 [Babjeviella inositovora NRRL Y-12698]
MRIAFNRINSFSHKDTFSTTSPDGSLSPVSIFVPIFRDKKDDISCIVENLATGTIQEEDLMNESFISSNTCDAPLNFKDPRFYNVDPEEDTLHELGPNPESPEYSKIKFEKFAQLLLYDGNGKCSKRPKSMSTSTINSETVAEGSLKRKRGSRKSYDGLASPSRSNSIKRIKRLSSRMSRTNETEENITPLVEVEGEAGEMDYSTIKSILKARVNTNLEQESFRAERCDEVDVDDFIEYFESHERKKSEAEPFLGKIRKSQISQYYTDLVSPGCV